MKLFLSSKAISYSQSEAFMDLVGKSSPEDIRVALIENAADVYEESNKGWMYDNRSLIQAHGFQVDLVDLEDYTSNKKDLLARLKESDVIWLGGGNAYYLRWVLRQVRADSIISDLVKQGKVYGGGSAGAIVAGPTLRFFEPADDPTKAPKVILDGLNLANVATVPHWASKKYGDIMELIERNLRDEGYDTVRISDDEALVINGSAQSIVGG